MPKFNLQRASIFARAVHTGEPKWQAAKLAGYSGNNAVLGVRASELMARAEVKDELARLKSAAERAAHMTRDELLFHLAKIVRPAVKKTRAGVEKPDPALTADDSDRVGAAKLTAQLQGWMAPKKVEHSGALQALSDDELLARNQAAVALLEASKPGKG